MAFTFGRLQLDDPLKFDEQSGDPMTNTGGAPVPAIRTAQRHSVAVATFSPVASDSVATRLKLRRQLRSLLNNTPMKQSALYLAWDADTEQNGWYIPDQGMFVDGEGASGLATGYFKVENFVWFKAGSPRTHRRATWVYLKDLRGGLFARDVLRRIYSTDFSTVPTLALTYFPPGVSDLVDTATNLRVVPNLQAAGEDGGATYVASALTDLARVSYEQAEANRNLGQVVLYDRRGFNTAPMNGPDANWEEFYGPDYNYTAGDVPVLDNGRVRVRYDNQQKVGFRVDWWTGAVWSEQGKVNIQRRSDVGNNVCDTLVSTEVIEYSETRAVVQVVMSTSADAYSREAVYVTMEQGASGVRFEIYPASRQAGTAADAAVQYTLALDNSATPVVDADDAAAKFDGPLSSGLSVAPNAVDVSTAQGTGHTGLWATATLGAASFATSENSVAVLRGGGGNKVSVQFSVVQSTNAFVSLTNNTTAYGVAHNQLQAIGQNQAGYMSVAVGFVTQQADQIMEAESMTLGANTSSTADAAASGGNAATSTRTTDANAHTTRATWVNGVFGKYRVFARVKTTASTLNIYAKTGATTGATQTTTSATYVWVDLGDIVANNTTLEIHCWATAAATVSVDRMEAFLLEDRTATVPNWAGSRDLGQSSLQDNRSILSLVTRSS